MHQNFKNFISIKVLSKAKYNYHINTTKKINTAKKGFTMIEVLIAVTIIAILTVIVTPNLINKVNEAKFNADVSNARAIAMAIKTELMSGTTPDSITSQKLADDYFDGSLPTPQSLSKGEFTFKITNGNTVTINLGSTTLYPQSKQINATTTLKDNAKADNLD